MIITQFFLKIFCIILFQLSTLERQVFDFLGYMWAPIIANTVQIICCILGIFGTYQMKAQFVVVVSCWSAKFAVFMSVQTQFCYWSNKNSVMNIFSQILINLLLRRCFYFRVNFNTCIFFSFFQYSTWSLMWLGWNIFVICLYLEVGVLNRVSVQWECEG